VACLEIGSINLPHHGFHGAAYMGHMSRHLLQERLYSHTSFLLKLVENGNLGQKKKKYLITGYIVIHTHRFLNQIFV